MNDYHHDSQKESGIPTCDLFYYVGGLPGRFPLTADVYGRGEINITGDSYELRSMPSTIADSEKGILRTIFLRLQR